MKKAVKYIGKRWKCTGKQKSAKAVIFFIIEKNGKVSSQSIKINKSSGETEFDQRAIKAIKESSPFPPLPKGYIENTKENTLGVYFEFKYIG
jgi:TonB family protein